MPGALGSTNGARQQHALHVLCFSLSFSLFPFSLLPFPARNLLALCIAAYAASCEQACIVTVTECAQPEAQSGVLVTVVIPD